MGALGIWRASERRANRAWKVGWSVAALLAVGTSTAFLAPAATARTTTLPPRADAGASRTSAVEIACNNPGRQCQQVVLRAIDLARAAEGVVPLELPSDYGSLSQPEQLLVLAQIERVDRGLPGFDGLSSQLDLLAAKGAEAADDPVGPPGTSWGSNWAAGESSTLLADYDWMYNDGPGSPNVDCPRAGASGCWDHRRTILGDYGRHPSMGAAATRVDDATSMTELFSSAPAGRMDYVLFT